MEIQISNNWNLETASYNFDAINIVDDFQHASVIKQIASDLNPRLD
jgi:hypothetical protein